jgi:hypothetical protein
MRFPLNELPVKATKASTGEKREFFFSRFDFVVCFVQPQLMEAKPSAATGEQATSMPTPAFISIDGFSECVTREQIRATIEHNRFHAIHI